MLGTGQRRVTSAQSLETVRRLSHAFKRARGEVTNDDATLFLLEWRGGSADHLAQLDA